MIAIANRGNVLSLGWFLAEILPRAGDVKVALVGNVEPVLRKPNPLLYERHRGAFQPLGLTVRRSQAKLLPLLAGR